MMGCLLATISGEPSPGTWRYNGNQSVYDVRIERGNLLIRNEDWAGVGSRQRNGVWLVLWNRTWGINEYEQTYGTYVVVNDGLIIGMTSGEQERYVRLRRENMPECGNTSCNASGAAHCR